MQSPSFHHQQHKIWYAGLQPWSQDLGGGSRRIWIKTTSSYTACDMSETQSQEKTKKKMEEEEEWTVGPRKQRWRMQCWCGQRWHTQRQSSFSPCCPDNTNHITPHLVVYLTGYLPTCKYRWHNAYHILFAFSVLCVQAFCLHASLCSTWVPGAFICYKRMYNLLELQF